MAVKKIKAIPQDFELVIRKKPEVIPTESKEQIDFIQWCKRNEAEHPELWLIFAVPNGGKRNIRTAAVLKLEGVKAGVPDLFLACPRNGYHGLFIEMKRIKGGKTSQEQKTWLKALSGQGYKTGVAKGFEQAKTMIKLYLGF